MSPRSSATPIRSALLIVNPGARNAGRDARSASRALQNEGIASELVETTGPGDATEIARRRAESFDAVFTLGGDGTAMEVITALANGGPPVGVLPGGTGNVLARALGTPLSVERAVRALAAGHETRMDLGQLPDGRYFAIGVGVGADEAMLANASRSLKRRLGVLAYLWASLKALIPLRHFDVRLTVDGVLHERRVVWVLIANQGSVFGELMRLGGGITPYDGVLHACLFSPGSFLQVLRTLVRMTRGTADRDPSMLYIPGRKFRLETSPPRRAQADGELLGDTPIEVSVRPRVARLLKPGRGPRNS